MHTVNHKTNHFAFLKDIRIGDIIEAQTVSGETLRFKTVKAEIMHIDHIAPSKNIPLKISHRLSLITHYPFNALNYGGPMRYVITATPINERKERESKVLNRLT